MSLKKNLKKSFFIHHWCGLIAGVFILVISLSGVILVFDDDIDAAMFARQSKLKTPAKNLKLDKSIHWVRDNNPGYDIRIPDLPTASDEALLYELRKGQERKWLFVHPETGEKLRTIAQAHNRLAYVVLNIHYNLLAGLPGKILVLLVGVALLVLTVTGFILYRRSIWKVLTLRQKIVSTSRRSIFSSLHRIIGVWALAFNLLMCVTGLSLAITVVNSALKDTPEAQPPGIDVSVDAAFAAAKKQYPDFEISYVRFPFNQDATIQFLGRMKTDPSYYGKSYSKIPVDYKTGELGKPYFLRDQSLLTRFLTILHPVHFGDFAGLPVKLLYAFFGLMPGILTISGFLIWKLRSQKIVTEKTAYARPRVHMPNRL